MIGRLKTWYAALSLREQRLVAVAGILVALVIAVYGLLLPAIALVSAAEKDLDAAIERRGRIEARADYFDAADKQSLTPAAQVAGGETLEAVVKQSALAAGLEIADGAANGPNQFGFRLPSVKAGALLAWLSGLESQGVALSEITLRKGENGFVAADVKLARSS